MKNLGRVQALAYRKGAGLSWYQGTEEEIKAAYQELTKEETEDLKAACENIRAFAMAQKETLKPLEAFSPLGLVLGHGSLPGTLLLLPFSNRKKGRKRSRTHSQHVLVRAGMMSWRLQA